MKPISFLKVSNIIGKDQPEYLPLPAHVSNGPEKIVTTCWKMSLWERIKVLVTGRVWIQQMTYGTPLQPQKVIVENPLGE